MKKGGTTSNNNVQSNSNNNKDETTESEQKDASGSDIVSFTQVSVDFKFLKNVFCLQRKAKVRKIVTQIRIVCQAKVILVRNVLIMGRDIQFLTKSQENEDESPNWLKRRLSKFLKTNFENFTNSPSLNFFSSLKKKQIIAAVKNENDPFCKPPIAQLKKTGEPFLQDGPCFEVAPKLAKCRECRLTPSQRFKTVASNIFCRFYAFRKLK